MAKKPTLSDVTNIYTSATTINLNNDRIEEAFENTLSRDGSTPNQMEADIDLNSNDLLNVNRLDTHEIFLDGEDFSTKVVEAEGYANLAQAWAESPTAPGDPSTKSAKTWAGIAAAAAEGVSSVMPEWFGAVGDGVTDDTDAYQAALNYGAGAAVVGKPGSTYAISRELSLKSKTFWDHNGSELKAVGVASPAFFTLWKPENGAHSFRVVGQRIDCNNIDGMIGFVLRVGQHDGIVDGFLIKNFPHEKDGVDGGRGFVIESQATVLDNSNLIVTNGICRNGYMGFAFQSGDAYGDRHNVIVDNITVEDCNVVYWMPGNTANYPHTPTEMQGIISNITAHNCGKAGPYTNGGGAFASDRACNVKMSNIVLSNDASYGSIPCVWHGNGSRLDVDITYHGDCTNFWNFQPYKEDDAPPATENTIQDAHLNAMHHGSCTNVAVIGTAAGTAALNVHIKGQHDTIISGRPTTNNLLQSDVWFDIFHKADNSRIQGRGFDIGDALFVTHQSVVRRCSVKDKQTPYTRILTIADGAAASVAIPSSMFAFQAMISGNSGVIPRASFACRGVATEFVQVFGEGAGSGGATFFGATGALTGATGLTNRVAVSVSGGLLYIENQSGTSASFAVTIFPSL